MKKKLLDLLKTVFTEVPYSDPALIPDWSPWPYRSSWPTDGRGHSRS